MKSLERGRVLAIQHLDAIRKAARNLEHDRIPGMVDRAIQEILADDAPPAPAFTIEPVGAILRPGVRADARPAARQQVHRAMMPPLAAERRYVAALRAIMRGMHRGVRQIIEREILGPAVRFDAPREVGLVTHLDGNNSPGATYRDHDDNLGNWTTGGKNSAASSGGGACMQLPATRPGAPAPRTAVPRYQGTDAGRLVAAPTCEIAQVRSDAPGRPQDRARRVLTPRLREKVAQHVGQQVGPYFDRMARDVDQRSRQAGALIGITVAQASHGVAQQVAKARDRNIALMQNAGRDYVDDVRDVLTDPENEGLTVDELQDVVWQKIKGREGASEARAKLIATDQTLKLSSALHRARQVDAGIASYRWSTSRDERVRPMHEKLEGQQFDWDDPPITNENGDANHPGEDFQCVPGDSELQAAHGVVKAFRRWYDGELATVVTDSGKTIRATPNHPVLTRRGWVALGSLELTDHVLEVSEERRQGTEDDQHDRVACIGDVFASLQVDGVSRSVLGAEANFHGDGAKRDVDVVLAARPLVFGRLASRPERIDELALAPADSSRLHHGAPDHLLRAARLPADGPVCRADERHTALGAGPRHPQPIGLAATSDAQARFAEPTVQHDPIDAGALGDREEAFAPLVRGDDCIDVDLQPVARSPSTATVGSHADSPEFLAQVVGVDVEHRGHLVQGLSATQQFVRVRRVDRLPFHGYVLNLETATGWYATQGILAHNCRCVPIPVIPELEEDVPLAAE